MHQTIFRHAIVTVKVYFFVVNSLTKQIILVELKLYFVDFVLLSISPSFKVRDIVYVIVWRIKFLLLSLTHRNIFELKEGRLAIFSLMQYFNKILNIDELMGWFIKQHTTRVYDPNLEQVWIWCTNFSYDANLFKLC